MTAGWFLVLLLRQIHCLVYSCCDVSSRKRHTGNWLVVGCEPVTTGGELGAVMAVCCIKHIAMSCGVVVWLTGMQDQLDGCLMDVCWFTWGVVSALDCFAIGTVRVCEPGDDV